MRYVITAAGVAAMLVAVIRFIRRDNRLANAIHEKPRLVGDWIDADG